jgi:hypothetical protein
MAARAAPSASPAVEVAVRVSGHDDQAVGRVIPEPRLRVLPAITSVALSMYLGLIWSRWRENTGINTAGDLRSDNPHA